MQLFHQFTTSYSVTFSNMCSGQFVKMMQGCVAELIRTAAIYLVGVAHRMRLPTAKLQFKREDVPGQKWQRPGTVLGCVVERKSNVVVSPKINARNMVWMVPMLIFARQMLNWKEWGWLKNVNRRKDTRAKEGSLNFQLSLWAAIDINYLLFQLAKALSHMLPYLDM